MLGLGVLVVALIGGLVMFGTGTGVFAPRATPQTTPKQVKITNVADQRQIQVPPGQHQIKFEFIPVRLYQGAMVSGLTLVLALTILVCLAKRK